METLRRQEVEGAKQDGDGLRFKDTRMKQTGWAECGYWAPGQGRAAPTFWGWQERSTWQRRPRVAGEVGELKLLKQRGEFRGGGSDNPPVKSAALKVE